MSSSTAIEKITIAKKALADASSFNEIKEIHDVAVAAEAYARARNAHDAFWLAVEVKLRAERKAGQLLKEMGLNPGRPKKYSQDATISELGISKDESSRWQRIASIPDFLFEKYLITAPEKGQAGLLSLAASLLPHVARATGEIEWYTPEYLIEPVRTLMKTIDVDPASSDIANEIIKANKYYTIEDDGLTKKWGGNVYMNPPYSQPLVTEFCNLLVEKYRMGEIKQACVLVNNATETGFYQNMMNICKAICFIKGRVQFIDKKGNSMGAPLQGQTLLYFGDNYKEFGEIFSEFGVVLYAY